MPDTVVCQNCAAAMPAGHRYCGACARPLDAARVSTLRRYRGPFVVGGIGSVLLLAGGGVAAAIFSVVQVDAAPGLLLDLFRPFVTEQVDGTGLEGVVDLERSGEGSTTASATMVALFVGGAIIGALGALLLLIACAWGAARAFGGRGPGTFTTTPLAPGAPGSPASPTRTFTTAGGRAATQARGHDGEPLVPPDAPPLFGRRP